MQQEKEIKTLQLCVIFGRKNAFACFTATDFVRRCCFFLFFLVASYFDSYELDLQNSCTPDWLRKQGVSRCSNNIFMLRLNVIFAFRIFLADIFIFLGSMKLEFFFWTNCFLKNLIYDYGNDDLCLFKFSKWLGNLLIKDFHGSRLK